MSFGFFPPIEPRTSSPAALGLSKVCYRVSEALKILSMSRSAFYGLAKDGRIKIIKHGTRSLVLAADLARLLVAMRDDGGIASKPRKPKSAQQQEPRP